jgi:hypothetical protein
VKADIHKPLEYGAILLLLLAYRIVNWLRPVVHRRTPVVSAKVALD